MKIREKIHFSVGQLLAEGPITVVALGDSVTHGALGEGECDYESVYWNRLRRKIQAICRDVPVNVINAGIGGTTALQGAERLDRQVLCHRPDLVTVCFGLNDVNGPLEDYLRGLREIFTKCKEVCDVIFMTPNMLNTYVAEDTPPRHLKYAEKTARMQNDGTFDRYVAAAIDLARELDVTVCDCYAIWQEMSKTEDTTLLLANRINHPVREMHEIFAQSLFDCIFAE